MHQMSRTIRSFNARVRVLEKTFVETDLTAAATTQTLDVGDVPAGAQILGVGVALATPFTGGGITAFTMSLGTTGDDDALIAAANIFAAAVDGEASTRPLGIAPNKRFAAKTTLKAKFDSTTANVVAATAGALTLRILYVVPSKV